MSTEYKNLDDSAKQAQPVTTKLQTVELIAPADMPAGYQFSADVNGKHVLVQVPQDGVKEGQHFRADVVQVNENGGGSHSIPLGQWRDGIFDCCSLGVCHQQFCTGLWLTPIALGQVLTRMKLDWSASPIVDTSPTEELTGKQAAWSAFKIMFTIFVVYEVLSNFLYYVTLPFVSGHYDESGVYYPPQNIPLWAVVFDAIRQALGIAYGLFILMITLRTRAHIRHKYSIPEKRCSGCEDCCCSFWCGPCTICQMARHTADYRQYKASCCTETGLDLEAPEVV